MQTSSEEIHESHIIAYLRGDSMDQDQLQEVERWLVDKNNQLEARAIYQLWEISSLANPARADEQRALENLRLRAGITSRRLFSGVKLWISIAAAACIVVASISIYLLTTSATPYTNTPTSAVHHKETILLPDRSSVDLNRHSTIHYDTKSFDAQRIVHVTGEAFFEVTPDSARPFIVKTLDGEITVLGTKFLVQALPNKPLNVLVTEGRVSVRMYKTGQYFVLNANEQISPSTQSHPTTADVNRLFWKTEILHFENDSLSTVFRTLASEFNVRIEISQAETARCLLNATFRKQSLDTILEVIRETHGLTITKNQNHITVSGHACQ